ncbi:RasGEF domain-containing protein, partial [Escherichia coli]|nr:RasGEF domain-containing protein [Escherichia coli]
DAIRRYIDHFNAMALWITAEVLAQPTPATRAATIVRFVRLGVLLLRYNNFSALVELAIALRRDVVARLRATWALVPPPAME